MLTLDLANLSESDLSAAVAQHCATLGTASNVTVRKSADQIGHAVALVDMSTAEESDRLLHEFGDSRSGSSIVVRLEQEAKAIPASLKLTSDTGMSEQQIDLQSCVSLAAENQGAAPVKSGLPPILEILLVEDDPADVRMTREALRAAGIASRLHVVEDGMDAVSFLCQTRQFNAAPTPHIVVLDLNIPRLNGHEVLGEIRSNDRLRDIPVVVLTCSKSASDMHKSYQMKADRFMTKAMGLDTCIEQMKSIAALAAR